MTAQVYDENLQNADEKKNDYVGLVRGSNGRRRGERPSTRGKDGLPRNFQPQTEESWPEEYKQESKA